jgi:hypothetical protein
MTQTHPQQMEKSPSGSLVPTSLTRQETLLADKAHRPNQNMLKPQPNQNAATKH